MPFVVPPKFHCNSPDVIEMGPPADIGATLIDYLARQLGRTDLAGLDVLDLGCGTRFTDTFMNRPVPVGSYTGLETRRPHFEFLRDNAIDPRLSFFHFDSYNPHYNPAGKPLTPDRELPSATAPST